MCDSGKILIDGKPCDDLKQREAILQSYQPNSRCVQYDDIKSLGSAALREIFTGKDVVYVYHNQIDARGDKLNTENEVFLACEEAITEIHSLIMLLTKRANKSSFIVTADHGFIYKRDKLTESDKNLRQYGCSRADWTQIRYRRGMRYRLTALRVSAEDNVLKNEDNRIVSFPHRHGHLQGGGQRAKLCPRRQLSTGIVDNRYRSQNGERSVAVSTVKIELVSLTSKIKISLRPLTLCRPRLSSDVVKETQYKVSSFPTDNERISNENIYVADRKDAGDGKAGIQAGFTSRISNTDKSASIICVAYDDKKGMEILRHEIIMDIALVMIFGFNL
jgi:hypothetical protein